MFDLVADGTAQSFVLGDFCSSVTKPLAESMQFFNLWQISYSDVDSSLADYEIYPNFLRTIPCETDMNAAIIGFIKSNNWTRVATIFQDASTGVSKYAHAHNSLVPLLEKHSLDLITTESFADDPGVNLESISAKDGRVIIAFFDEQRARQTFCQVYHKKMYGHKYIWILPVSYTNRWWKDVSQTNCSEENMALAINGYFTINVTSTREDYTEHIINGKTVDDYNIRYENARGGYYSEFNGYAYDAVWLMVLALEKVLVKNKTIDWSTLKSQRFIYHLTSTKFSGVTGDVHFLNRIRLGQLKMFQHYNGALVEFGSYDMADDKAKINSSLIYWQGESKPPLDRIIRRQEVLKPSLYIQIVLITLAVIGQALGVSFLAVNIKFRNTRYIRMSSPYMNNIVIVGCMLIYSSIYLLKIDPNKFSLDQFQILCTSRSWVLSIGFSLAFGAMFVKTWRVYRIFNAPHQQKKAIKDQILFLVVAGLIVIDIIFLVTWLLVNPLHVVKNELPAKEVDQVLITPILQECRSANMNIWVSLIYSYKGLLLVAGCWFAWQTRHVCIPALNDSKYIGLSVYNVVIMCASAVAISYTITDEIDYSYLIIGLLIILCTTTTLCLLFVPKVLHLRKKDALSERRPRVKLKHKQRSVHKRQNGSGQLEEKMQELLLSYDQNYLRLQQLKEMMASISQTPTSRSSGSQSENITVNQSAGVSRMTTGTESTILPVPGISYMDSDSSLHASDENESST